jgi:hypothetical protein
MLYWIILFIALFMISSLIFSTYALMVTPPDDAEPIPVRLSIWSASVWSLDNAGTCHAIAFGLLMLYGITAGLLIGWLVWGA